MTRRPLDIPSGIFPDDTSLSKAGRWRDASLVRFHRGRPQTVGGWELQGLVPLTGVCRSILPWTDNAGTLNIGFGTHSALQVSVGGALYNITPANLAAGQVNGTGGAGYGTGAYGVGGYSQPSTTDYFPRTWSLAVYGQWLIANPRAQTIYVWQNATNMPAVALSNAPAVCTTMLVTPTRQVMALGCSDEITGVFNPLLIRYSDLENPTVWQTLATNEAGDYTLSGDGGGRIVGAKLIGRYVFCWTDNGLYLGSYVGSTDTGWKFDRIGDKCGLIGPNAVTVVGQSAYWMAPSGQFYTCGLGGSPTVVPSPVQDSTFANIAPSQRDKIVCSSTAAFGEVRWDYPDQRDGLENSRYVTLSLAEADANGSPAWSRGIMSRTAYADAGPADSPLATTADGAIYWHERGHSANGQPLAWYLESADQAIVDLDRLQRVNGIWPDMNEQVGPVWFSVFTRMRPQSSERKHTWTLAAGQSKRDFRATGRLGRVRFEGASVPSFARMGSPVFDPIETSGR